MARRLRRSMAPLLVAMLALAMLALPAAGQSDRAQGPPDNRGLDRAEERVSNERAREAIARNKARKPVEITLLHDTHFHGKFGDEETGEPGLTNIGRYMALVQQRKDALGDNVLFLGNGDDLAPSVMSSIFEPHGIHMIEALNVSPIDVNTLGNHEFDYGPDNLREILAMSEVPFVTANVRDRDTGEVFGADLGVEEFIVRDIGGVKVGITGLGPQGMATVTTLGPDTEQIDAQEALEMVVPKMRDEGADVVVVTSHLCGSDAIALADVVHGVDVIAGDHCAQVLEEPYVSPETGTIVSLAGHEFGFLGELTLRYHKGEIRRHSFTLHDLAADHPTITPLPAVQSVVEHYEALIDEELNVVIGTRTVAWDTRVGHVRTEEAAIGNFVTDEMRDFHGADIAVTNGGGIREDTVFPPGDITRLEIIQIFPFGNTAVKAEIAGEHLLEALEHSVRLYPANNGGFLQVSGIEMVFDPAQPAGERVHTVLINGEPLELDRIYTMATNDFTLGGGDGYDMFADHTTVLVGGNEGPPLDTMLIDRIEARDGEPVTTDIEGRITTGPAS